MKIIVVLMILGFLLVGLLLLKAGVSELLTIKRVRPELQAARGVVLRVERTVANRPMSQQGTSMARRSVQLYPIIQFTKADGTQVDFKSEIGEIRDEGSLSGTYSPGQEIEVLYHPANKIKPRINSASGLYTAGIAMAFGGCAFVGASITMITVFGNKILQ
jgi:hypothetical protein